MARSRSHRHRGSKKNILNKGVSVVKSTSNKYMPKVKSGLENVGSKVIRTGEKSVPFLQSITRKIFGAFGLKQNTKRHRRRHRR